VNSDVSDGSAIVSMSPEVPNVVLAACTNPRRFGQAEEHIGGAVQDVDEHKYRPILRISAPVLSRVRRIERPVGIGTPSEGSYRSPDDGILIDCYNFMVRQDVERLLRDC